MHRPLFAFNSHRESADPKPHHDYLFVLGVAIGTGLGFILGSIIALRVGEERVETLRRAIERAIGREEQPKFEFLLQ